MELLRIVPDWNGRKSNLAVTQLARLAKGTIYEVFGGSGTLSLNHGGVLWNDADRRLFNLALAIQHDADLAEKCRALPAGCRGRGAGFSQEWPEGQAHLASIRERFADGFYEPCDLAWLATFTFGARLTGRVHMDSGGKWAKWIEQLPLVAERLAAMRLSSRDALDAIGQVPSGNCVYADPPYTNAKGSYARSVNHEALWEALNAYDGRVLLSGYDGPRGWRRVKVDKPGFATIRKQGFAQNRRAE